MGFTAHPGAAYNVEGTINKFILDNITAQGLPTWMASSVVNFDYPDTPLTYPSFSVTHLAQIGTAIAQGNQLDPGFKGRRKDGIVEVNCWESKERGHPGHNQHVKQMADMVSRVFATGASTQILDVYGSTANPTSNGTLVRMGGAEPVTTPRDPNPDVLRIRILIGYNWLERATAT